MVTVVALNAAVQLWSQNWPIETRELDASVGKIWAAHDSGREVGKLETCGVTGLDVLPPGSRSEMPRRSHDSLVGAMEASCASGGGKAARRKCVLKAVMVLSLTAPKD
jgi:hypothetical protein